MHGKLKMLQNSIILLFVNHNGKIVKLSSIHCIIDFLNCLNYTIQSFSKLFLVQLTRICIWYFIIFIENYRRILHKHVLCLVFNRLSLVAIISKRQKIYLPALRVWASDTPHPQEEVSLQTHGEYSTFFKIRSETYRTEAQFCQNLYMVKKESLLDWPKFCQSGSAVWHLFWRLIAKQLESRKALPKIYKLLPIETIHSTINSDGRNWKHIFGHPVKVH